MPGVDKDFCVKELLVHKKLGWTATSKDDYVKKKTNEPTKYEFKSIDCKTEGKKYLYKTKSAPVVTNKWKCNGSGPCVKDSTGTYNSKAECETATGCDSGNVTPPPSTGYSDCEGPKYYQGCKDPGSDYGDPDPDGDIYKVQGCIGAKQDSLFGPKTKNKLKAATGKINFKVDEIGTICKESVVDGGQSTPQSVDDQRKYWNNLIENEQIWKKGFLYEKGGKVVYIIKTDLDNPNIKYPLESLKDADLSKFDYIAMFVPKQGEQLGRWGMLAKTITVNGDEKIQIQTKPEWTWEPNEKQDYVDILETRLRKILKSKLQEQKFYGRAKKTDDSKGVNTSGDKTISGAENKTDNKVISSGPVKADPTKVKDVIDPIRVETITLLEEIKGMVFFQAGATPNDKKQLDEAIKLLQNFDSSKACETENQQLINQNLVILNDMISKNENKFGAGKIVEKAKQVRSNLERVKSECDRLNSEANKQSQSNSSSSTSSSPSSSSVITTPKESEDLLVKFGFVRSNGKTYNPKEAIEGLGKQPLGNSGEGTLQSAIDLSGARSEDFADYNKLVGSLGLSDQYKLKIPMTSKQKPGAVITEDNESILFPLRDQGSKGQYTESTFGTFLGTVTPNAKIYLGKKQTSATQGSDIRCSVADPRSYLLSYITRGLKASVIEDIETLQTERQTICGCYKSGAYDTFKPVTKDELVNITKDVKPFGWLVNRRLTWNDVEKLMRGESVSGQKLNPNYHDKTFGTTSCVAPLEESLKNRVKNRISEAISGKKVLTESLKDKILKDIIKRY